MYICDTCPFATYVDGVAMGHEVVFAGSHHMDFIPQDAPVLQDHS